MKLTFAFRIFVLLLFATESKSSYFFQASPLYIMNSYQFASPDLIWRITLCNVQVMFLVKLESSVVLSEFKQHPFHLLAFLQCHDLLNLEHNCEVCNFFSASGSFSYGYKFFPWNKHASTANSPIALLPQIVGHKGTLHCGGCIHDIMFLNPVGRIPWPCFSVDEGPVVILSLFPVSGV